MVIWDLTVKYEIMYAPFLLFMVLMDYYLNLQIIAHRYDFFGNFCGYLIGALEKITGLNNPQAGFLRRWVAEPLFFQRTLIQAWNIHSICLFTRKNLS